ncbi:MAG: hypothetical protein ABR587_15620 [Candidatus Binatia bacterium]
MADLPDVSAGAGAPVLQCDRAIFTSLPSPTGEGYRLVAWSTGVRPEERTELTRRAPSHGSLSIEGAGSRGLIQLRLQSTGRVAWGFVRVAGAEHTRRGGGRVWTEFLIADAAEAFREGLHPGDLQAALSAAPPVKPPVGSSPLARVDVGRRGDDLPAARDARAATAAASVAAILLDGRACVIAAGSAPTDVFEDALRMIPASLRTAVDACAGLRLSSARGVKATLTDRFDQDTVRATRGQGIECIDLQANVPPAAGAIAPWLALMSRWWSEERGAEAVALADRLSGGWSVQEILDIAEMCEAIDRGQESAESLEIYLLRRRAA